MFFSIQFCLPHHLSRAYASNMGGYKNGGFIEVLAAQQSPENPYWFQPSRVQQLMLLGSICGCLRNTMSLNFLFLLGIICTVWTMRNLFKLVEKMMLIITVAAFPMDEEGCIIEFAEKPKGDQLKVMKVDTIILGLDDERAKEMPLQVWGISVVGKDVILSLIRDKFPGANDFGGEVIPGATSLGMRLCILIPYHSFIFRISSFFCNFPCASV